MLCSAHLSRAPRGTTCSRHSVSSTITQTFERRVGLDYSSRDQSSTQFITSSTCITSTTVTSPGGTGCLGPLEKPMSLQNVVVTSSHVRSTSEPCFSRKTSIAVPPNKQLQRTVTRRHVRAASAPFHYALTARSIG